jgi:hypothetical protein
MPKSVGPGPQLITPNPTTNPNPNTNPKPNPNPFLDTIDKFVFVMPKSVGPGPQLITPNPDHSNNLLLERMRERVKPIIEKELKPFYKSKIRQEIFFPDRLGLGLVCNPNTNPNINTNPNLNPNPNSNPNSSPNINTNTSINNNINTNINPNPRKLVQFDSGKLQTLSKLLSKLKGGGHKCLIFTQMSKMLDILEVRFRVSMLYVKIRISRNPSSNPYTNPNPNTNPNTNTNPKVFLNLHAHTYVRLDGSTGTY